MLDHMNPEQSAGEYVDGSRTRQKQSEDRTQKVGATPEPATPPVFYSLRAVKCLMSFGPGGFGLLRFDEYAPPSEVEDFSNKTSK
jgi:hypothetical protein